MSIGQTLTRRKKMFTRILAAVAVFCLFVMFSVKLYIMLSPDVYTLSTFVEKGVEELDVEVFTQLCSNDRAVKGKYLTVKGQSEKTLNVLIRAAELDWDAPEVFGVRADGQFYIASKWGFIGGLPIVEEYNIRLCRSEEAARRALRMLNDPNNEEEFDAMWLTFPF